MYEFYKIEISKWDINLLVKTKNDRIVDPEAVEHLERIFPDFEPRFLGSPFSEFKHFLETQYRSHGISVTEVAKPGGRYTR